MTDAKPKIILNPCNVSARNSLYSCLERELSNYANLTVREKAFVLSLLRTNLCNKERRRRGVS